MSAAFYLNKLYPLQDAVLKILSAIPSKLYLTGGTALSRVYLQHRYSDDLDFFVNRDKDFEEETKRVFEALGNHFKNIEVTAQLESFARAFVKEQDVSLKLEFVNDVGYHAGDFMQTALYHKMDNPMNILSNKLCALSRNAGKDLADIIFLSKRFAFNWETIVNDARQKDTWVNEVDVSKKIYEFPLDSMQEVNWINPPVISLLQQSREQIAKEILLGADNSLVESK